jgi:dCTP deaminase
MGVLPDWMIERDVKITPFSPQQHRPGVISYGVTSYGYDVRVGHKFKVFSPICAQVIDPKAFDPKTLVEINRGHEPTYEEGGWYCWDCKTNIVKENASGYCPAKENYVLIPPNSFALAESLEHFDIPRDVLCLVVGKSTYARCGLVVNVTPGEPDWKGHWTIELSNTTPLPIKVYAGEGIMQCVFIRSDGLGNRPLPRS